MTDAASRLLDPAIAGLAEASLKARESDLRYVAAWARLSGLDHRLPMSVDTVLRFAVEHIKGTLPYEVEAGLVAAGNRRSGRHAPSTVKRRLASISVAHIEAGLPNPCSDPRFRLATSRMVRCAIHEGWKPRRSAALHGEVLERALATCGDDLQGVRDRALILFGVFSGGRRRSEVHAALVERLMPVPEGYLYRLGPTKGSRSAETGTVPIHGRCAAALDAWLRAAGLTKGPLFRPVDKWGHVSPHPLGGEGIQIIVKRRVELAGYDPGPYTAHSLRSGFMTTAVRKGIPLGEAMALSFHRSESGASIYYRPGLGYDNMAARLSG